MTRRTSPEEGRCDNHPREAIIRRVNYCAVSTRVFGEINPILLALAIGVAVLDATCFSVVRLGDAFLRRISRGMENAWQLNADCRFTIGLSRSGSAVPGQSPAHTSTP